MGNVILLVDDDRLVLRATERVVRSTIGKSGMAAEVLLASSPEEALELAKAHHEQSPALNWCVITDFNMPGMNGGELIDALGDLLGGSLHITMIVSGLDENRGEADLRAAFFARKGDCREDIEAVLTQFFSSV